MPTNLTRTKTVAAGAAVAALLGVYAVTNRTPPQPFVSGGIAQLVSIGDDEKLEAEGAVRDILKRGADAGELQHRPAVAHTGVLYGQMRQAGLSHGDAMSRDVQVAQSWAAGGNDIIATITPLGDDEVLDIVGQVSRIGQSDWGSVFDLGTQYGARRQAGYSIDRSRFDTGQWLVLWFGGDNPWQSALPPPSSAAAVGRTRLTPQGYADDTGPVLPVYAHYGNALSLFARDEAQALAQLDDVSAAGYRGIRYWNQLGCGLRTNTAPFCDRPWENNRGDYWHGHEVGPGYTRDYWTVVRRFLTAVKDRHLRVVLSQGDPSQIVDRPGYMRALVEIDRDLGVIDFIDGSNEGLWVWEDNPAKIAGFVQNYVDAGGTAIRSVTSGSSEGTADVNYVAIPPSQVFDIHSDRGGRFWDWNRHIFSSGYDGHYRLPFGISSEPPGGGALVSNCSQCGDADDESVPLLAVTAAIARQAFVWFSGEGVIIHNGLKGEPGFWTTPKTMALLPKNMMAWPSIYHAGKPDAILGPVSAGRDVIRTDCREGDGQAVCAVYGPAGDYSLPVKRGFVGRLCNPGDGVCADVDVRAGQTLQVAFHRGRVLLVSSFH